MKKQELIETYLSLFAGRPDCYAIRCEWDAETAQGTTQRRLAYVPSIYNGVKETTRKMVRKIADNIGSEKYGEDAVEAHLYGKQFLGVYPLHEDNTVKFFALDFDGESPDEAWEEAYAHYCALRHEAGIPCYIETSQSGNGFHVWAFLDEPLDAGIVRRAIRSFINKSEWFDRMFPNQNRVTELRPLGNLIALPLFAPRVKEDKSCFVDPETREPYENQPDFLSTIERASVEVIKELADNAPELSDDKDAKTREGIAEGDLPGIDKVLDPRFGCEWVRWHIECPEEVSEPEWYALACNLAQLKGGREAFHRISSLSARYDQRATDAKFDQAVEKNAPHSCEYIRENLQGPPCTCDERFPKRVYHPYGLYKIPIFDLMRTVEGDGHIENASDGMDRVYLWAQEVEKDPSIGQGLPYGIGPLDEYTGFRPATLNILAARPSIGKALHVDTPVLTPTGWTRMGDIKIGDRVIGGNGQPCTVTAVYPQGKKPLYRVSFADGSSVECCKEHLWHTTTRADRRKHGAGAVRSTEEIMDTLHVGGVEHRLNHQIPWVAPIEFNNTGGRPLDPYLLGVLLGDGSFGRGVRLHNPELSVLEAVSAVLPESDELRGEGKEWRVSRKVRTREVSATLATVRELGLAGTKSNSKFVPTQYLYAPSDVRLAVLSGLLDTDGYVTGVGFEYVTVSEQLAKDVKFLAQSLGAWVTVRTKVPTYRYRDELRTGQLAYRLFLSFGNGIVPTRSSKHGKRLAPYVRNHGRTITSVEYTRDAEAQCITVDSADHLYVTDDFVVTHNTALALDVAYREADANIPVYFFSLEMSRDQLWRRLLCRAAGVSATKMVKGQLSVEEWQKMKDAMEDIRSRERFPFYVDDTHRDIRRIADAAWNLMEEHGPGVVMVDYLGLLDWYKGENEYAGNTRNSKECKLGAKATNMPWLVLHQFNRQGDDTSVGAETFDSWLRSTGQIEADADSILFLLGDRGPGIKEREIVIQKERDREAGHRVMLEFNQAIMQFGPQGTWYNLTSPAIPEGLDVSEDGPEGVEGWEL